ncbi:ABC transporter ATP-binding protein/permease [Acholeplasma sp. OttesenSCG-928-E16]|nr:ABC transporter ATP-binding protein/permease [Acholeplasma sp. OttesenSCG-928-E16]
MVFGKHFTKYYIKYLWAFLIGIAILIAIDWIQLEVPMIIGRITDTINPSTTTLASKKDDNAVFTFLDVGEASFKKDEKTETFIYTYKDDEITFSGNDILPTVAKSGNETTISYSFEGEIHSFLFSNDEIKNLEKAKIYDPNWNVINEDKFDYIWELCIQIILHALVIALGRFLWRFAIFGTARQIEYELRRVMFNHATHLSQDFYSHKKVGGLMTYFINDLNAVREAFGPGILHLVDGLFLGGFSLYRMFTLNEDSAILTLILLIPIILLMIIVYIVNKSMRLKFRVRQDSFENMSDFVQESFSGISVIKAFVREYKELLLFKKKSSDFYEKNIRYVKQMTQMQIVVSILSNIIILIIISAGGYFIITDTSSFTAGSLVTYMSFYSQLLWPISAITRFFYITGQARASSRRIAEFLDSKPGVEEKEDATVVDNLFGNIKVNNLTFKYPDGESPVLKNVSFEIKKGENIGILGKTGSGKTTLVDLFMRIYDVSSQTIFIDGHDIMDLSLKSLRGSIGYVPQDNFLFSETIADNIAFSDETINMEKVVDSAILADINSNVMEFSQQYETILGERGVTVSGGQKQRISIARALYKDANFLILDDSVSAVDTKTEEAIIHNLHEIRKGKTTIFIAHRISTVKHMDKIILLDDGKIVGIGSHDELLHSSDLYKDMVRRQTLESIVEGSV